MLTVGICTWNRAEILDRTLARLREIDVPADQAWELVVVDNNSSDDTPSVLVRHSAELPLRAFREPQQGVSFARNRVVGEARGEYLVWTDDDVLVDRGWLRAYAEAFRRHPNAALFGGPIAPEFASPPPRWLELGLPVVEKAYAVRDLGTASIPLTAASLPYGANYAVRMDHQRRCRYDTSLGRKGKSLVGMEELDACARILAACGEGWWIPEATVRHFIPEHRMSLDYLRAYYRGQGEQLAITRADEPCAMWMGKPRWAWRQAAEGTVRYWAGRLLGRPESWLRQLMATNIAKGRLWPPRNGG